MKAIAARPKMVADLIKDGPRQSERRTWHRAAERTERRRAGDPIRREAGPALEAA
jgi:hypothetical protein